MLVSGTHHRAIRPSEDRLAVEIVDQTLLPLEFRLRRLETLDDVAEAIRAMRVRGAPLIGVTAAYGVWLALLGDASDGALDGAAAKLSDTRPTAVNLRWALGEMRAALRSVPTAERAARAFERAGELAEADVATCFAIGEHGSELIQRAWSARGRKGEVQILTHCNAGWLACVDWGTALAPIYRAHDEGIPVHVWVDETRPRNQGAALTAWELGEHGIPHTVVVDNAGGHLMQRGQVDLCLVGTDRTTALGDVCNKIGTYLKALAARDCGVPFYVAAPSSSIDWSMRDGTEIPIEERDAREVGVIAGWGDGGVRAEVSILPPRSGAANPGFDVTPARLVSALVTERGVCDASPEGLERLFPERCPKPS